MSFARSLVDELALALQREPALLRLVAGRRRGGKTTAAEQLFERLGWFIVCAATEAPLPGTNWVKTRGRLARLKRPGADRKVLLILDEVPRVVGQSGSVERKWEEERRTKWPVLAVRLGSSALLGHEGKSESLAGGSLLHYRRGDA